MRYFIEIQEGPDYNCIIHKGERERGLRLSKLRIGPQTEIRVRGGYHTLDELIQRLIENKGAHREHLFDVRGQLEIGHHLFSQTIGQVQPGDPMQFPAEAEVELRIVTKDEHIARLPWALLANNGIFLTTTGWSVALSRKTTTVACELPPSPRLLVVAPQPRGEEPTQAEAHLQALRDLLSAHDHRLDWHHHLKLVETWADFTQALPDFAPQIIYYYGHGQGDSQTAHLLFAEGHRRAAKAVPTTDFANRLRHLAEPPKLVYVNCCHGDAAGYLGIGNQLADFVPAVITNRTTAMVSAAQAQAMALWKDILLHGVPPHRAVAHLYSRLGELGLSTADLRWMTPVLHCHYGEWRANPPRPPDRSVHDPHWQFKIDRIKQFGVVSYQTQQMLREQKPRSHAFVWYGRIGEGVDGFHQRLTVELREHLPNVYLYEVRPEWPNEFTNVHRSCQDMLCEAFGVSALADIPARVRAATRGTAGVQALIYVRHQPVPSPKVFSSQDLHDYLEWWDSHFVPLLERQQFALLGVSFLVNDPSRFQTRFTQVEELHLAHTVVRLLDELERLAKRDLRDFLQTHNIRLPLKRQDQVLEKILQKTEGHYEATVEELKNVVDQAWDQRDEEAAPAAAGDEEEEW